MAPAVVAVPTVAPVSVLKKSRRLNFVFIDVLPLKIEVIIGRLRCYQKSSKFVKSQFTIFDKRIDRYDS
jgi:hypothetical protein